MSIDMETITSVIAVGSTVAAIVLWSTRFQTKVDCKASMDDSFERVSEERKEIWRKVDQIYDWMVTGVVDINKQGDTQ